MNLNSKVVVRIEYRLGEKSKVCYGEIEETKLERFETSLENFICVENDGKIAVLDKESLLSIETLKVKKILLLKPKITKYFRVEAKIDKDTGICS